MKNKNKDVKKSSDRSPTKNNKPILKIVEKAREEAIQTLNSPFVKHMLENAQEAIQKSAEMVKEARESEKVRKETPVIDYKFQKEVEENRLRRLLLEKLEKENNTISSSQFSPPSYNSTTNMLLFMGKIVQVPPDSNQDTLCRVIFKNKTAMRTVLSWDEILEEAGETNIETHMWRKVYDAGREINNKVAIETGIKDLLIVKKSTVVVNPKYLKPSLR